MRNKQVVSGLPGNVSLRVDVLPGCDVLDKLRGIDNSYYIDLFYLDRDYENNDDPLAVAVYFYGDVIRYVVKEDAGKAHEFLEYMDKHGDVGYNVRLRDAGGVAWVDVEFFNTKIRV